MKKSCLTTVMILSAAACLFFPAAGVADEQSNQGASPSIFDIGIGYRGLNTDGGGETLSPYGDLDSDLIGFLNLFYYYPWGGTMSLSGTYDGNSYYGLSGGFNYRGDVDFSVKATRYPRNAEHLALPPSEVPVVSYQATDQDPDARYALDVGDVSANLKLRVPSYPAHITLGASRLTRQGDKQQVFNDYSCTTNCHLVSSSRDVDTRIDTVTLGADAHFGFVDAAYSYQGLNFKDNEPDPTWDYGPIFGVRDPQTLEHNTWPDISSQEHAFTFSTTNTGRIAATAGYSLGERTNEDSDLTETYDTARGSVLWRPHRKVSVSLRYFRQDRDDDSPGDAVTALRDAGELPLSYGTTETTYAGTLNLYPISGLKLRGDFKHREIERQEAEGWDLPEKTTSSTWKVSAQMKPSRLMDITIYHQQQTTEDPAYATTPTKRSDTSVAFNAQPWPQLLFQSSYLLSRGESDESVISTGTEDYETDWEDKRQLYMNGITLSFEQPWTVGLYWIRFTEDVTQNIIFGSESLVLIPSRDVPYEADGDQFMLQAAWKPSKPLDLKLTAGYLETTGRFRIDTQPFADIDDYSRFDAAQWRVTLGCEYQVGGGWGLGGHLGYATFDDKISSDNDEIIREISAMVSKRW